MGIFGKLFKNNFGHEDKDDYFQSLSIVDLSKPIFSILPRLDYIEETSPLYPLFKMRCEQSANPLNYSKEFLKKAESFIQNHPEFDFLYYWLATHQIVSGQYKKADAVLNRGINNAEDRSLLATQMGDLKLRQSDPIAIGWSIQACLLATIEFAPYKSCSVVAKSTSNESLYWRLRNAGDVISTLYSPTDEGEMQELVGKTSMDDLQEALAIFEEGMDKYLPMDSDIPKEKSARDIFLSIEREYIQNACDKLFRKDISTNKIIGKESGVKSFKEKSKECINCNATFPEGELQCSVCGFNRFIWE